LTVERDKVRRSRFGPAFVVCERGENRSCLDSVGKAEDIAGIRELLLGFGVLSKCEQMKFLSNMNDFMYASPYCRKQMLLEWEVSYPVKNS
jgi:hypothetical protein